MMKKAYLLLILTAVLLTACKKTAAPAPAATAAPSAAVGTEAPAETEATNGAPAETPTVPSLPETEASEAVEEESTAEPSVQEAASEPVNTHYGYFVKYGDKVYYRRPGADAMKETAIFGNFLSQSLGSSKICSYDTKTGTVAVENGSLGYGPMAVCGESLYLSEMDYPNDMEVPCLCSLCLTEYDYVIEGAEKLSGTGKDGRWVVGPAITQPDDVPFYYLYYTDGNVTEYIESENYLSYIGAAEDYLVYEERRSDGYILWRCNMATGELLRLGTIPTFEEWDIPRPGEADGFAYEDGKIAIVYSAYEGTGNFLAGSQLVTADLNKKDSLEYSMADYTSDYYYDEMSRGPGVAFINGKAELTDGMPLDVEVDGRTGDLILFDEEGKASVVASGYNFFESEEEGTTVMIEDAEFVDGKIYAVRNEMWHVPEEDIGWRYAYERKFTYILEIDPATGEEKIIDSIENSI